MKEVALAIIWGAVVVIITLLSLALALYGHKRGIGKRILRHRNDHRR